MKQIKYIFFAVIFTGFISCGGGETKGDNTNDETTETPVLKGYEPLDLSEWGFNMSVMVPNAEANGEPSVILTERGALEVSVGTSFGLEIMYGEGDLELLKMDLKEDLVFSHQIIKEEENALVYSQDIPESGVKTQNHFFYKAQLGNDVYEVRDLMDGEFGEGMIEEMLSAAKTLKSVAAKAEVAV